MFEDVLSKSAKILLQRLTNDDLPKGSYLGGGTAVALQLGHRRSEDLDFFSPYEFVEAQWEQKLTRDLNFRTTQRDWQTIIGFIGEVKFSLFGYRYKLIAKPERYYHMQIASLADLSAMKLDVITRRGTKRDFIDLYFLSQKFGLSKLFEFYQGKYGNIEEKEIMIKKGLIFFDEADLDEMPDMLVSVVWEEIKRWFVKEVKK